MHYPETDLLHSACPSLPSKPLSELDAKLHLKKIKNKKICIHKQQSSVLVENLVPDILAGIDVLPLLFPLNFCPSFGALLVLLLLCKWPLRIREKNLVCDIVPKSLKENHVQDHTWFSDSSFTSCDCALPCINAYVVYFRAKRHIYSYGFFREKEKC